MSTKTTEQESERAEDDPVNDPTLAELTAELKRKDASSLMNAQDIFVDERVNSSLEG